MITLASWEKTSLRFIVTKVIGQAHKFIQVTDTPYTEHALRLMFVKRLRSSYY